ncbi:hypothetical protein B0J12DRAFT_701306 [Macrophomina phaseolina]|uniref:Uncharacterized protein n=1 Tax=Macrophomina phaseolina TaxID=35725 RepID=A0ABQ8G564_9PEZI|nr:hypothetical protein B0J12DRAFT_701306 [Macrophomina phaseolina]
MRYYVSTSVGLRRLACYRIICFQKLLRRRNFLTLCAVEANTATKARDLIAAAACWDRVNNQRGPAFMARENRLLTEHCQPSVLYSYNHGKASTLRPRHLHEKDEAQRSMWLYQLIIDPTTAHTYIIILLNGRGSVAVRFSLKLFKAKISADKSLAERFPSIKMPYAAPFQRESIPKRDGDNPQFQLAMGLSYEILDGSKRYFTGKRHS